MLRRLAIAFFIMCSAIALLVAAACAPPVRAPKQQRLIVLGTHGDTLKNIAGTDCDMYTDGQIAFITTPHGKVYISVGGGVASCEPQ